MKEIIRRFTCGHPTQMKGPVAWLFAESFFMSFPAVAVYFAINLIAAAFQNPGGIDTRGLWTVASVLGALAMIQFLVSAGTFLGTYLPATVHSAENKIDFIKKLRALPLGFFLKKESGELINTFTGDFLAVEQSMVGMFTGIFSVVFACALTSVFMFIFNPAMALALYISMPAAALIIALSMNLTARLSKRNIEARDKTGTYLNEYLLGMKTLKSYNQTGEGFGKLKDAYLHLMKVNISAETVGGSLMSLSNAFIKIGLPLMCFSGAYMILGGRLSVVDYLGLAVIGTKIISPILTWVRYMVMLRMHYVSATRIDGIMRRPPMKGDEEADARSDIEFRSVSFSYSGKAAESVLNNVTFTIPNNKLTAVVGPSGGGKTTVLRLIARFWDADSGDIISGGKSLKSLDADKWIDHISMVLQDVYLFHDTIRENILFGRKDADEEEMIDAAKRAQCHDFIMALPEGYDTLVGEGGSTLSGGEKQRISIARAILKDAPILLLDEPTASLDARNEVMIQRAISSLVNGRTVVMIAHRLKTVQNAHQILVIDKGSVAERGTHAELIAANGLYRRLWELQNRSINWQL
jgi:ATP-binding cassette subfamily B protein